MSLKQIPVLEEKVLKILTAAEECELRLTDEDSQFDLILISDKLVLCSKHLERLSGLHMELTRIAIEVTRACSSTKRLEEISRTECKLTDTYIELPTPEKTPWLLDQLKDVSEEAEKWQGLKNVVSEVRSAVKERASTMKRLDSDLRLHSQLYEARVKGGATPPPGFDTDSQVGVDDIDLS